MRYINLDDLLNHIAADELAQWEAEAAQHLANIRGMTRTERSDYLDNHPHWTGLYAAMSALSNHKCWYTESPENSGAWEIDHFRPQKRSKQHDGSILLPDGYWWLAYVWRNYRLTGSLANKLRKDKFNPSEKAKGKANYFPLKLDECQPCGNEGDDLDYEIPYLLDPTVFHDTTLISFDKNGEPMPTHANGTFEYERVIVSVICLALDITPLNRQRKRVWDNCEAIIYKAARKIGNAQGGALRKQVLKESYEEIRKLAQPSEPYSSVARSCIKTNAQRDELFWLRNVLESL